MASVASQGMALSFLTIAALAALPQTGQASILGDQFTEVYWFPDLQTRDDDVSFDPVYFKVKPGTFGAIDLGAEQISISYSSTARTETLSFGNVTSATVNTSVSFDGPLLTVFSGNFFGTVVATTGLGAGAVNDTRAALFVNLAKADGDPVSVTFALPGVPLPASAPMFGAALLATAGVGCAIKRGTRRRASASAG